MLDEQDSSPKEVNCSGVLIILLNRPFEDRYLTAFNTKYLKKLIPKCLRFRTLARLILPLMNKGDRVIAYFGLR